MMFFRLIRIGLALAIALGLGTFATWHALRGTEQFGAVTLGGWTAYPEAGTEAADPYAKARLARDASLSLGAAEGVTFFASRDSEGSPLTSECDYTMEGKSPPARFWTLYTVGPDQLELSTGKADLPNTLHSGELNHDRQGGFEIAISATAKPQNWLAVPSDKTFWLAYTLYDSPVASNKGLIETAFPIVRKIGCNG